MRYEFLKPLTIIAAPAFVLGYVFAFIFAAQGLSGLAATCTLFSTAVFLGFALSMFAVAFKEMKTYPVK